MLKKIALATAVAIIVSMPVVANAKSAPPIKRCITTTWAAQHYHTIKTPRHTTCVVRGTNGPAWGSIGYGGATVSAFTPEWYPSTWATIGVLTNTNGDVTGLLVRSA